MMEIIEEREASIPVNVACCALGVPRATLYRHRQVRPPTEAKPRPPSPRRLSEGERQRIIQVCHSERFIDQPVRQIYTELLDEGLYYGSPRTMYRVLAERGETRDRRDQRAPKSRPVPRIQASGPNEIWSWDITKLATLTLGVFLNLYVVLDLFSRFVVAWMVAARENSALAKQLFAEAISRYGIDAGELTVHNDRGAPMTAVGFADLLSELGVDRSLSRPRVSNDNPFSESHFKTAKYQPDYPGRFDGNLHARTWFGEFFQWYNHDHRHSGIAFFTPAMVFHGEVERVAATRQAALDEAFQAHPERFVHGRPKVRRPPRIVAINPLDPDEPALTAQAWLDSDDDRYERETPHNGEPPACIHLPGAHPNQEAFIST